MTPGRPTPTVLAAGWALDWQSCVSGLLLLARLRRRVSLREQSEQRLVHQDASVRPDLPKCSESLCCGAVQPNANRARR